MTRNSVAKIAVAVLLTASAACKGEGEGEVAVLAEAGGEGAARIAAPSLWMLPDTPISGTTGRLSIATPTAVLPVVGEIERRFR